MREYTPYSLLLVPYSLPLHALRKKLLVRGEEGEMPPLNVPGGDRVRLHRLSLGCCWAVVGQGRALASGAVGEEGWMPPLNVLGVSRPGSPLPFPLPSPRACRMHMPIAPPLPRHAVHSPGFVHHPAVDEGAAHRRPGPYRCCRSIVRLCGGFGVGGRFGPAGHSCLRGRLAC